MCDLKLKIRFCDFAKSLSSFVSFLRRSCGIQCDIVGSPIPLFFLSGKGQRKEGCVSLDVTKSRKKVPSQPAQKILPAELHPQNV